MGIDATPPPASGLPARLVLGPALRAQSDRRLVRLVREGYESAFEEIVRRYRRPLDRFAASIVGGRSEDVTQDSFGKALVALRDGEGEVELRPWLYRIVRNTALNDLRDRPSAAAELTEDLIVGGRSAAAEAEQREEIAALTARLLALPPKQRAALVMRELEGMGHEEIAAALGVSGGAARQAIARARATVRSGFGALVPLPLLRALAGGSDAATEAAVGAGAAAVGTGAAGAGALKVGLATVLVAGSIGAGVAIEHHGGTHRRPEAAKAGGFAPGGPSADAVRPSPAPVITPVDDRRGRGGPGPSGRDGLAGDDDRGSGHDEGSSDGGSRHGGSDDNGSGRGGDGSSGGSGKGGSDSHGGSGSSGSTRGGDGSGDSAESVVEAAPAEADTSGSGSSGGSSGGGDSSSTTSASGSSGGPSPSFDSSTSVTNPDEDSLSGDGSGSSGGSEASP